MVVTDARIMGRKFVMKIALISPDGLSTLIFCKTMSNILHKEHNAEVVTISSVGTYKEALKEIKSTHIDVPMARWLSPCHDLLYLIRLYLVLKGGKFEQVITFTTKPNIYGVIAARMAGIRSVTMAIRGLGQVFNEGVTFKHRLIRYTVKCMYWVSCRLAHKVWFTNKSDLKYFQKQNMLTKGEAFLTKNAVNLSEFSIGSVSKQEIARLREELSLLPDEYVVIMVARLIWSKGVREFAEAAKEMYFEFPKLHFLLVAPSEFGSPEAVQESYIRDVEAKSNLKWLGFRNDVCNLYAVADLSVLPSYYKEGGYPRALLEAMALGKPVIAADTEECKGPVDDGFNGYLVKPRSVESLITAIIKVFSDNNRRKEFGNHSLEKVRREFDDQIVIRDVLRNIIT